MRIKSKITKLQTKGDTLRLAKAVCYEDAVIRQEALLALAKVVESPANQLELVAPVFGRAVHDNSESVRRTAVKVLNQWLNIGNPCKILGELNAQFSSDMCEQEAHWFTQGLTDNDPEMRSVAAAILFVLTLRAKDDQGSPSP